MTIASEIQRIQTNIANSYMACNDKGATMPATQDSDNLATTIASIPTGGNDPQMYRIIGASITVTGQAV